MGSQTDRIEKQVLLRAPLERVWRAISDSQRFGEWFGVEFSGPFVANARIAGKMVPTKADTEVAKMQEPYMGMACDVLVERIEPQRLFSFRWHPDAGEPPSDFESQPTTLVMFELEERPEGTLLTITESGFDRVPLARRAQAFANNEEGWSIQTKLIGKYLANAA